MLWLIAFSLISVVRAEVCDVSSISRPEIAARNFYMVLPADQRVLAISTSYMTREALVEAAQLLRSTASVEQLEPRLAAMEQAWGTVMDEGEQNFTALRAALESKEFSHVGIESTQANMELWERVSGQLYAAEFAQTARAGAEEQRRWRRLLLATIGAPMVLRASEPNLLSGDALFAVDLSVATNEKTGQIKEEPAQQQQTDELAELEARAKRKGEQVLRSLQDNPQTRRAFRNAMNDLKPGSRTLRRSDAQIKRDILRRIWRQDKRQVGEWVDLQLAYLRAQAAGPKPAPKPEPQPEQGAGGPDPLYTQVTGQGVNVILFISEQRLSDLADILSTSCREATKAAQP